MTRKPRTGRGHKSPSKQFEKALETLASAPASSSTSTSAFDNTDDLRNALPVVEKEKTEMEELEEVAGSFEGVEKCFAVQAGREVRIMVEPDSMDDVKSAGLARDIVKNIEDKLAYPGQIKVVVIREKRSVEYAR